MFADFPIALLINGFALALSTAFLLITLWYDLHRIVNQVFVLFLIAVQLWNVGFLINELTFISLETNELFFLGDALWLIGFTSASVLLYALITVIASVQPRRFLAFILLYMTLGIGYSILLANDPTIRLDSAQARVFVGIFFIGFDVLTLFVLWHYRRKVNSVTLMLGTILFIAGQAMTFLNPELGIVTLATTISALGTVCISIALVRREIIRPLLDRGSQLEVMHDVSLAITSQFNTDTVLNDITAQAATWLNADAACIFLDEGSQLKLVATHKLPATVENIRIPFGHGVAGTVVQNNQSVYLENYDRDWAGEDEFPFARSTFGSLICVPLIYNVNVIGALLVISGKQGTLFEREDVHLLELLATQTAVAISHGRLFTDQQNLTTKLKSTNEQLQKVLISTENPVLAVDRRLNLIFTNPAAETLFGLDTIHSRANLQQALPAHAVPKNYKEALRSIKRKGSYSYEIELNNVSYMCQVASLGNRSRVDGFVAVMNDVSELVELDRIKSEMVRMTSHDLKNPLQAAFANLELLNEDIETIDDEEIHLSVGNIETQLNKMFRIISGILDLERVNAGVTLSETCNLNVIIADAVEELDDYARENGIVLRTDIDPQIADFMGDSMQFRRAVINIIENAIKFNSPGGEVLIRAQNRSHDILISISDDGIGIPQAVQSKIFERFFRGHQPGAEHISGSGLGLSLVKAVVESHNGKIWMRSQPNIGTTFNIAVPAIRRPVNAIPN